jgi:hypothetical protein
MASPEPDDAKQPNVGNQSSLLTGSPVDIFIETITGQTYKVAVLSSDIVSTLKLKLQAVSGVNIRDMQLMTLEGQDLKDEDACPQVSSLSLLVVPCKHSELMDILIDPGTYEVEIGSSWATETESCCLTKEQAAFWTQQNRDDLLSNWSVEIDDVLENWVEEEHGTKPKEGDPWWFDALETDDCEVIYQGLLINFPCQLGNKVPLTKNTCLLELLRASNSDVLKEAEARDTDGWKPTPPCTYASSTGYKGNDGTCDITVEEPTKFGDLLNTISGDFWVEGTSLACSDSPSIGDQDVYIELGRSKCYESEVTGPV